MPLRCPHSYRYCLKVYRTNTGHELCHHTDDVTQHSLLPVLSEFILQHGRVGRRFRTCPHPGLAVVLPQSGPISILLEETFIIRLQHTRERTRLRCGARFWTLFCHLRSAVGIHDVAAIEVLLCVQSNSMHLACPLSDKYHRIFHPNTEGV
jgi:hypothetical protein